MLIALDIGNSSINVGIFNLSDNINIENFDSKFESIVPLVKFQLTSSDIRCADEYAVLIHGILSINQIVPSQIISAIIASVVPQLTSIICEAVKKIANIFIMIVGPGIKTGLDIKIDDASQLGADIVANTVAAQLFCHAPFIVIDFGTATTLTVVNQNRTLCGIIIMPGIRLSLDSLAKNTALLTYVSLNKKNPPPIMGKNSEESIKSGIINSMSIAIDGFIDKIKAEINSDEIKIISTGGFAPYIIGNCTHQIIDKRDLTLVGLMKLYIINAKQKHRRISELGK